MTTFIGGLYIGVALYILGILSFLLNGSKNIIMLIISLEIILLSLAIILIHLSVALDDLVGSYLSLLILPLAGAESSVALALLVAYYPYRGTLSLRS